MSVISATSTTEISCNTLSRTSFAIPVQYGLIGSAQGFFTARRRDVERLCGITGDSPLIATNTVVFDFVVDLVSSRIELQTDFSGDSYRQDLLDTCGNMASRSEPTFLAQALWLSALSHDLSEDQRELATLFLAIVIGWPPASYSLLVSLRSSILDGSCGIEEPPETWSLFFTAKVLQECRVKSLAPVAIAPLVAGGVGLAWSKEASYADVEVTNDRDIVFSTSPDRRAVSVLRVTNNSDGIASGLARVSEIARDDG